MRSRWGKKSGKQSLGTKMSYLSSSDDAYTLIKSLIDWHFLPSWRKKKKLYLIKLLIFWHMTKLKPTWTEHVRVTQRLKRKVQKHPSRLRVNGVVQWSVWDRAKAEKWSVPGPLDLAFNNPQSWNTKRPTDLEYKFRQTWIKRVIVLHSVKPVPFLEGHCPVKIISNAYQIQALLLLVCSIPGTSCIN